MIDADLRSRGWRRILESGPVYDATLVKVVSRLKASADVTLDDIAVQFEDARWERQYA